MTPARAGTTDAWGVTDGYEDTLGRWRPTSAATRAAIHAAMDVDPAAPPAPTGSETSVVVLHPGDTLDRTLPADLPLGYHTVRTADGADVLLIVAPRRCHLPPDLYTWGWATQLYAARSAASWGIGDLADLAWLGRWASAQGAGLLLVNPFGAPRPVVPQQPSPYFSSSRRYRNPLYLRIEEIPGAAENVDVERLAAAGRALNADRRIDRDAVHRLKQAALETLWRRFGGDPAFDRYVAAEGRGLHEFATFQTLAEHHEGASWRGWPSDHRRPHAPGVRRFAADHRARVDFHQWVQWQIDMQLGRAVTPCRVMQDLPIGFDPEGADAWAWQDLLATGATVGAPPDRYIDLGQDWGLPPFIPHRLRAAGYRAFIETLRAAFRHAGGLRIDHVMGLFRLFWVPRNMAPAEGGFVRYPADDLLAIVALESQRASAVVRDGSTLAVSAPGPRCRDHARPSHHRGALDRCGRDGAAPLRARAGRRRTGRDPPTSVRPHGTAGYRAGERGDRAYAHAAGRGAIAHRDGDARRRAGRAGPAQHAVNDGPTSELVARPAGRGGGAGARAAGGGYRGSAAGWSGPAARREADGGPPHVQLKPKPSTPLLSRIPAPEGPTGVVGEVQPATPRRCVDSGVSISLVNGRMKAGSCGTLGPDPG
jgi:4-alpha-glucanotransferase